MSELSINVDHQPVTYSLTYLLTHSYSLLLAHSLLLTHSLTYSLTHSLLLTHSLTHALNF